MAWWVVAIASGPEAYADFSMIMSSLLGKAVLFAFTFSLMLHLCNGIRHPFWDMGKGFSLEDTHRSSKIVLISSTVLTVLSWMVGYGMI